ncbi:MAG: hypothetical protein ACLVCW_09095 [Campylobacter sp.]
MKFLISRHHGELNSEVLQSKIDPEDYRFERQARSAAGFERKYAQRQSNFVFKRRAELHLRGFGDTACSASGIRRDLASVFLSKGFERVRRAI